VGRHLDKLIEEAVAERRGKGKNTEYRLKTGGFSAGFSSEGKASCAEPQFDWNQWLIQRITITGYFREHSTGRLGVPIKVTPSHWAILLITQFTYRWRERALIRIGERKNRVTRTYRLTKAEQETVIRSSAANQEWDVCTADPRFIRYLKRQGYEPGPDHQLRDHLSCRVPFRRLRISKKVVLTDEKRAQLAIQLKMTPRNRGAVAAKSWRRVMNKPGGCNKHKSRKKGVGQEAWEGNCWRSMN
jgi:hypothetical protein